MNPSSNDIDMSIAGLHTAYRTGSLTPEKVCSSILELSQGLEHHNIWITLLNEKELQPYLDNLDHLNRDECPLWGIPFTLKDNIDLAG
nr:allophanate hydrolase [Granulosicoccus sp.]